ncbi:hypothetical protein RND81_08G031600 [Saponaria officinalis]|uniref:N-acetyltransferase domain-containing protein n=1 Tax=Saponaria officinalis TaxID=3572 RepID=A0AAW1J2X1_SAPOF
MSSKLLLSSNGFFMLMDSNLKHQRLYHLSCKMKMQSKVCKITEENNASTNTQQPLAKPHEVKLRASELQFTKQQSSNRDNNNEECRYFGDYVAREALLDEEYWTAAWLRAESHWKDRANDRYADSYKRQFAEQEFNALKRKCKGYIGQKTNCIVAVRKEEKNIKRSVIKSVVGTLDLSIKNLLLGESFPGEKGSNNQRKQNSKYGYVSNLCVAKSARRKGIAINMLTFAIESAISYGAETIFVHVHRKNTAAQQLYQKLGFQIVDEATHDLEEQMYLLSFKS